MLVPRHLSARGLAVLTALTLSAATASCEKARPSPLCADCNIVLISMDTLRADHVGAYGYEHPTTPNLDELAAEAVLFERAISQSAWTRPAHISMFTGLYPSEHGVIEMSGRGRMPRKVPTLATTMRDAGYATAAFTGGANMSAHFGFDRGFDVYESHGKRMFDNVDAAGRWVEENKGGKFFLFFHGFDPHRPYVSDVEDRRALGLGDQPAKGWSKLCERQQEPDDLAPFIGNYDAGIHRGDRALGALFAMLRGAGLMDNTVIAFTSDHGEEFFEHGRCFHIYTLYREIVEVPLIIRVPGIAAKRIVGIVPASVAISPTLTELVGIGGHGLPGPSLRAAIETGRNDTDFVISETSSRWRPEKPFGHVRALTRKDEKLVDWIEKRRREYYDLDADPLEQEPLERPDEERRLLAQVEMWLESHAPIFESDANETDLPQKLKEELRALGYLD